MSSVAAPVSSPERSSRLSTPALVAIAVVAMLVLGGLGVAIGASAESDGRLPPPLGHPRSSAKSLELGARSHLSVAPRARTLGGGPATDPGTNSVTLGENIVTVTVPDGWDAGVCDSGLCSGFNGPGAYAFAQVHTTDADTDPALTVTNMFQGNWVSQDEHYSQATSDAIKTTDLGGGNSIAQAVYSALYATNGGSVFVVGELIAVVRADGWVYQLQLEAAGQTFDDASDAYFGNPDLTEIFDSSINRSFLAG